MNQDPKKTDRAVSIICPVAGPAPFLESTLASVLMQTTSDWEMILIDNGCDRDLKVIAPCDARIRVLNEPQRGIAIARNTGLRSATGRFIAFLDSDDLWEPEKLALQAAHLKSFPEDAGVYSAFDLIDEGGTRTGDGWAPPRITHRGLCRAEGIITGSNIMVRRSVLNALGPLNETLATSDDADLLFRVTLEHRLAFIDRVLLHYRLHTLNVSREYWLIYRDMLGLVRHYGHDARGRTRAEVREDRRIGTRRIRTTYSGQAFDMFLATRREHPWSALAHLYRALRMSWRWPPSEALRRLCRAAARSSSYRRHGARRRFRR
jgi:glycosyltransferase involved in cell wall biosynthesis